MNIRFEHLPRVGLATLPTPLEQGPLLDGGVRLWVKRDDLTGLGMGGNKARKLEFLCADAIESGADMLITVGASQSNHCRMTAAAGARLNLPVHLVVAGERPEIAAGNQLLALLFGAHMHYTGAHESHWGELEIAREQLTEQLAREGAQPYSVPIGGSSAVGSIGYVVAFFELLEQCAQLGISPSAIVHTSSSGGTHAGLLAGRAIAHANDRAVPDVYAIGVAKGVNAGMPDIAQLANEAVERVGASGQVTEDDVIIDTDWIGADYAVPTQAGDEAVLWAARNGGWILDRVYTGKGLSGLLAGAVANRWPAGSDIVFIHTGGHPAVFATDGLPPF